MQVAFWITSQNEEGSDTELKQVASELSEMRNQLQAAFFEEDQLLAELAEVNEAHFPELNLQYPDLGIDTEMVSWRYSYLGKHWSNVIIPR